MSIQLFAHFLSGADRRPVFGLLDVGEAFTGRLSIANCRQHVVGERRRLLENVLICLGAAGDVERDRKGDERGGNHDEVADR